MIDQADIFRSAKLMVDRYGKTATAEFEKRSIELRAKCKEVSTAIRLLIGLAAIEVLNGKPGAIPDSLASQTLLRSSLSISSRRSLFCH
jgi:hypothetical protein